MKVSLNCAVMTAWLAAAPLAAQNPPTDPLGNQVSREALAGLLVQWEGAANSHAYSEELRAQAGDEALAIRRRLEDGDFRVGDRIFLSVAQETTLQDTFVVDVGPLIDLPMIGSVSLAGVLRAEVETYLSEQVARFVRNPTVRARSLLPITVTGGVSRPGFHTFVATTTLLDVLRTTGLAQSQELDGLRIRRGEVVVWEGDRMQQALTQGFTLDQLNLRAGDEVFLPPQQPAGGGTGRTDTIIRTVTLLMGIPFAIFGIRGTLGN